MRNRPLLFLSLLLITACASQKTTSKPSMDTLIPGKESTTHADPFLAGLLSQYPEYFDTLLRKNEQWQIKIIYTQVDRNAVNQPTFTRHDFNVDPQQYFYPASTVKMPVAFLSLQRLNELNRPGLDLHTPMITEAAYSGQTAVFNDPSTTDGSPNIAQYIRKIFLVSDNDAFNRLYEFLGQEYINNTLHKMGYDSVQVIHRLDISLTEDENRHTNPVKFYGNGSRIIYEQPLVKSQLLYHPRQTFLGTGYYSGNTLVKQPFNFSKKNRFSLSDLHSILQSVIFPENVPAQKRFNLKNSDYQFLYKYMSMKPRESDYPPYDTSYSDAYSKFLLYGGKGELQPDVRIFNKEGDAYGFLTDIAYVVDFKNNIEFFLSASISCNSDGIFNDDQYDYENTGLPFLKNLGHVIYQYELNRKKAHLPDLSKFKIFYGK